MIYTPKMLQAIEFATEVHLQQKRKGKQTPYIIHPLAVGLILAKSGADEGVIVAGILHDTIEDCKPYGSVTKEMISAVYGSRVAEMVNDVTEQNPDDSWAERKRLALEHVKEMETESVWVKSADVLHNLTDQLYDYKNVGGDFWERFNEKRKEKHLQRYTNLVVALKKQWPENPLNEDLETALGEAKDLWS